MGRRDVKAYGFVGDTVNTAKRVSDHAVGGQVLISLAACETLRGLVEVGAPLDLCLKGKTDPLRVYPVAGLANR